MSFIYIAGLGTVADPTYAPKDTFFDMQVIGSELHRSKDDDTKLSWHVTAEIVSHPEYNEVDLYVGLPHEDDDDKRVQRKLIRIQRACHLFNTPFEGGFDPDAALGAKFVAKLGLEEVTNKEGKPTGDFRNFLMIPRISVSGEVTDTDFDAL